MLAFNSFDAIWSKDLWMHAAYFSAKSIAYSIGVLTCLSSYSRYVKFCLDFWLHDLTAVIKSLTYKHYHVILISFFVYPDSQKLFLSFSCKYLIIGRKNKQPCAWLIARGQKINFWSSIRPLDVRKSPMAWSEHKFYIAKIFHLAGPH